MFDLDVDTFVEDLLAENPRTSFLIAPETEYNQCGLDIRDAATHELVAWADGNGADQATCARMLATLAAAIRERGGTVEIGAAESSPPAEHQRNIDLENVTMPSEQPTEEILSANARQALHDKQTIEVWLQGLMATGQLASYVIAEVQHYADEGVTTIHADLVLPNRPSEIGVILTVD
jgi:predicted AAA+ superfamily ATPase